PPKPGRCGARNRGDVPDMACRGCVPPLDKARNALHNPVTLPVVCKAHAASQLTWGSGALLERTCLAGRLAGTGAERGFPAAELLPAVSLVVAGRDQGGVSRSRQHRRAL